VFHLRRQADIVTGMKLLRRLSRSKHFAVYEACLIGLAAGLAAYVVKNGVAWLGTLRVNLTYIYDPFWVLVGIGTLGSLAAGLLVQFFAPEAAGSGIPQVKAILAGFRMRLNTHVAMVKLIGGTLAIGSGLMMGREGPTVQVGAGLAAELSRSVPNSPNRRRQLIAAGAGTGLAAAFNAPIAGVLFVLEELLKDVSGRTLGVAILACFVGSMVSAVLNAHALDLNFSGIQMYNSITLGDVPWLVLLGIASGILGALFNMAIIGSLKVNNASKIPLAARVALAGAITGLTVFFLPAQFRDNAELRHLIVTGHASMQTATICFLSQFFLTVVAYGSGAPGGLFAPALMLGAALGYMVGSVSHAFLGAGSISTFALAGMGAFFCGVARVPVTAIVIVFEMTRDFNLVLPLMISAIIAYLVSEEIYAGSVYDRMLELVGISLKDAEKSNKKALGTITAADIMQTELVTLSPDMTISAVLDTFTSSPHRAFPVVSGDSLLGVVSQFDLISAASRQMSPTVPVRDLMTQDPLTVDPEEPLDKIVEMLSRHEIGALPVLRQQKLVGLITRSDIIRAEMALLQKVE
jgi:CIC family chloride channel protein